MTREVRVFHDIKVEVIKIGGIAHWDYYSGEKFQPCSREQFLEKYEMIEGRKILVYGLGNPTYWKDAFSTIEKILVEIEKDRFVQPVQLIVRLHHLHFEDLSGRKMILRDDSKNKIESLKLGCQGVPARLAIVAKFPPKTFPFVIPELKR